MKHDYRPYVCSICGYKDKIQTNNEGAVLHHCNGCLLESHTYRQFNFDSSVNEEKTSKDIMSKSNSKFNKIKQLIKGGKLTEDQKRKILYSLKTMKEEYTGNVGGETDIANADNLVAEDEFTAATKPEPNVISKTFDTEADYDSYLNQHRGIEIISKEFQSVQNYREAKPTKIDRFQIRYETTDDFGNNDTTVIKKLKEGDRQFCWTAFSKHESAEEEGKPSEPDKGGSENDKEELPDLKEAAPIPPTPSITSKSSNQPEKPDDNVTVGDEIRITKSITFTDETQGANTLADFLMKLEI